MKRVKPVSEFHVTNDSADAHIANYPTGTQRLEALCHIGKALDAPARKKMLDDFVAIANQLRDLANANPPPTPPATAPK